MLRHEHVIVRAEVRRPPTSVPFIKEWLAELIEAIGMELAEGPEANPVAFYSTMAGNEGLTATAILTTSHCALHVWDAETPALLEFDLYSCSELDLDIVFDKIEMFEPTKLEYLFIDRETGLKIVKMVSID